MGQRKGSVLGIVTAVAIAAVAAYLACAGYLTASAAPFAAAGEQDFGADNEKFAAIVIEAKSGRILYERMSNESRYPASLTKMMTLYLLFEQLARRKISLATPMTVSDYAAAQDPTRLGLRPGDQITVETAIKAIVVRSANDVAVVVAEHLAGTEWDFAARMTQKARELGMTRTTFANASGLPDGSQRSTAYDLAMLSRRLILDYPQFYPYFSLQSFTWNGRRYAGHNSLMKVFGGVDGLKTGYTRMSGYNVSSSAVRRGSRLIGVVMGGRSARDRDTQAAELLESGFEKLGLEHAAPPLVAMSPIVPDDEGEAFTPEPAEPKVASVDRLPAALPAQPPETLQDAGDDAAASGAADADEWWGIQVGAQTTRERAEQQVQQVLSAQQDLLAGSHAAIVRVDMPNETFYRVRFGAFAPGEAKTLCQLLQQRGVGCLLVSSTAWDQANSRAGVPVETR